MYESKRCVKQRVSEFRGQRKQNMLRKLELEIGEENKKESWFREKRIF